MIRARIFQVLPFLLVLLLSSFAGCPGQPAQNDHQLQQAEETQAEQGETREGNWQKFEQEEFTVLMPSPVAPIKDAKLTSQHTKGFTAKDDSGHYMVFSAVPVFGDLDSFEKGYKTGLSKDAPHKVTFSEMGKIKGTNWHGKELQILSDSQPAGYTVVAENNKGGTYFALLATGAADKTKAEQFFNSLSINEAGVLQGQAYQSGYRMGFFFVIACLAAVVGLVIVGGVVTIVVLAKRKQDEV